MITATIMVLLDPGAYRRRGGHLPYAAAGRAVFVHPHAPDGRALEHHVAVGLAISIGVLVDSSIVMVENAIPPAVAQIRQRAA